MARVGGLSAAGVGRDVDNQSSSARLASAAAVIMMAGAPLALWGCGAAKGPPPPPPPSVTVAHPLSHRIVDWDDYTGRFEALKRVELHPRVSGVLTRIAFKDGQIVRAGQLLFIIDPRPYQAQLASARADEARAMANLALARSRRLRDAGLLKEQAVSQEEYDSRKAEEETDAALLAAAQAAVRSAALNVEFTQVRAPITGRVSDRRVDVGNLVQGGDLSQSSLLTTIVALDPIYFTFRASEALYIKYTRANQAGTRVSSRDRPNPVEIKLQDEPDYRWKGHMDFVDNALEPSSGTMRGRAIVANPELFLTPGMFGRMRLLGSGAYDALLVPEGAILTDQARRTVMVVGAKDVVAAKVVELGAVLGGLRIIRSGLKPDDRVVIQGLQRATPGKPVSPKLGRIEPPDPAAAPAVDAFAPPPASEATAVGGALR